MLYQVLMELQNKVMVLFHLDWHMVSLHLDNKCEVIAILEMVVYLELPTHLLHLIEHL